MCVVVDVLLGERIPRAHSCAQAECAQAIGSKSIRPDQKVRTCNLRGFVRDRVSSEFQQSLVEELLPDAATGGAPGNTKECSGVSFSAVYR
mgnify:CR=1 FL=1